MLYEEMFPQTIFDLKLVGKVTFQGPTSNIQNKPILKSIINQLSFLRVESRLLSNIQIEDQ